MTMTVRMEVKPEAIIEAVKLLAATSPEYSENA